MITCITSAIKALSDCCKSLFEYFKQKKFQQSETEILTEKKDLKKASDISEEVFWLMREYFAIDSQFTMWLCKIAYDFLNKDEKRFFRKFYKQKLKIKNKIEKLQKKFEKVD